MKIWKSTIIHFKLLELKKTNVHAKFELVSFIKILKLKNNKCEFWLYNFRSEIQSNMKF